MLIERITLTGSDIDVTREIAPEITLRATPAYPELGEATPLHQADADGNIRVKAARDSDLS